MSEREKIQLIKARVDFLKASYPLVCFGLAGIVMAIAIVAGSIPDSELEKNGKWTAIMGVVSSAITAGAGIAQAPRSNGDRETVVGAQEHISLETRNGAAEKETTKLLEQRN